MRIHRPSLALVSHKPVSKLVFFFLTRLGKTGMLETSETYMISWGRQCDFTLRR